MAKVLIVSDIHLEFHKHWSPLQYNIDADYIIFAGDVCTKPSRAATFFSGVRERTNATMLYVLGNHEYYGNDFFNAADKYRDKTAHIKDFHLLNNEVFRKDNFVFIGSTMWTDLNHGLDTVVAIYTLNDFNHIKIGKEKIMPYDMIEAHNKSVAFIDSSLGEVKDGEKSIVVTHHAPSPKSIALRFMNSKGNSCFAANAEWLFIKHRIDCWCHGHVHDLFDYQLGDSNIFCQPLGYPFEGHLSMEPKIFKEI